MKKKDIIRLRLRGLLRGTTTFEQTLEDLHHDLQIEQFKGIIKFLIGVSVGATISLVVLYKFIN